jgi:hypothetical protein
MGLGRNFTVMIGGYPNNRFARVRAVDGEIIAWLEGRLARSWWQRVADRFSRGAFERVN